MAVLTILLLVFAARSVWEYIELSDRPNTFQAPIGVSALLEGPFESTRSGIDPQRLPWIIDPAEGWSLEQRTKLREPCGLWAVLSQRYPLWKPTQAAQTTPDPEALCRSGGAKALKDAGWIHGSLRKPGVMLHPDLEQNLVLERHRQWELVLERRRGLVVRRRQP